MLRFLALLGALAVVSPWCLPYAIERSIVDLGNQGRRYPRVRTFGELFACATHRAYEEIHCWGGEGELAPTLKNS